MIHVDASIGDRASGPCAGCDETKLRCLIGISNEPKRRRAVEAAQATGDINAIMEAQENGGNPEHGAVWFNLCGECARKLLACLSVVEPEMYAKQRRTLRKRPA